MDVVSGNNNMVSENINILMSKMTALNNGDMKKAVETLNYAVKELFGDMSLDDMRRCYYVWDSMHMAEYDYDAKIYYENLIASDNIRQFVVDLQAKTKYCINNRNDDEYYQYINSFFEGNNSYINFNDNIVVDYLVTNALSEVVKNTTSFELFLLYEYNKTAGSSLYNYISSESGLYSKTRNNQLTK